MKDEFHVVSLSGGKDSTAMLLMMLERGMRVDEVVYADTGMEFPEMDAHIAKVEQAIDMPITYLRHPQGFEYLMFDYVLQKGERQGERGYGWARPGSRWCTSRLKTELIDRYFREISNSKAVVHYVGIAADESHRVKDKRYPLVEWGVTEGEALDYCYKRGFDWEGLYGKFHRVSCWCCPLKSLDELRVLRHDFPDLWKRILDMDARSCNSFRINGTAEQLDERFANEDRQLALPF